MYGFPAWAVVSAAALLLAAAWWMALGWINERGRRISWVDVLLMGEAAGPVEEEPRLRNRRWFEWRLSNRIAATRVTAGEPVVLRCMVTTRGRAADITATHSSGNAAFDEVAARAARWARFHPARVLGYRVPVYVEFPITYRLR